MVKAKKTTTAKEWLRADNQRRERERSAQQHRDHARHRGFHPWGAAVSSVLEWYGYDIDRVIEDRPLQEFGSSRVCGPVVTWCGSGAELRV